MILPRRRAPTGDPFYLEFVGILLGLRQITG